MESRFDPLEVVIALVTWPADRDPSVLARPLVERGLAACVNVLPEMRSIYRWNGAVHDDPERQLILKTTRGRVADVEALLRDVHPYDTPELLVLPVMAGSDAYLAWVREVTAGNASPSQD